MRRVYQQLSHCRNGFGIWQSVGLSQLNFLHITPKLSALFVLLSGFLALCGKLYFPDAMRRELTSLSEMPIRVAFGFVILGFSMRLARWEGISPKVQLPIKVLRASVAALAAFSIGEHFGGGIAFPLPIAVCFLLLGCTLILLSKHKSFLVCQTLICLTAVTTLTAIVASLYNTAGAGHHHFLNIDTWSAILLLVSCIGLLYANTHRGLMSIITSGTTAGSQARILLPASILIPIFLGWIRLSLQRYGILTPEVGLVLHVVATVVLMALVVWWNAFTLARAIRDSERVEEVLREVETAYRRVIGESSQAIYVTDVHGTLNYLNRAAERLFGEPGRDLAGTNIRMFLAPMGQDGTIFLDLLSGMPRPQLMRITNGGPAPLEVMVTTVVRFRNGDPAEVLAVVEPLLACEPQVETEWRGAGAGRAV